MQVHSLTLSDFEKEEYSLIGIHTSLEDYKLAYLLNKHLKTNFKNDSFQLDFKNKKNVSFSVFSDTNSMCDFEWFLVSNSTKDSELTIEPNKLSLFSETKKYLIPEKKNIDFFIKISGDVPFKFLTETIQKIKEVQQVVTSYQIDKNTLKSKDFLIF